MSDRIIKVLKPDHIVLNVADLETALHFYTEVLGLETERLDEFRAGKVGFPSVRMGEQLIDLFPVKAEQPSPDRADDAQRVNHFCLRIADDLDWQAVKDFLQSHNIAIESESARNFGAWGYGRSLYLRDPDHNLVELKQYQA